MVNLYFVEKYLDAILLFKIQSNMLIKKCQFLRKMSIRLMIFNFFQRFIIKIKLGD